MRLRVLIVLWRPESAWSSLVAGGLLAARIIGGGGGNGNGSDGGGAHLDVVHAVPDACAFYIRGEEILTAKRREEIDGTRAARRAEMRRVFGAWCADSGRQPGSAAGWREVGGNLPEVIAAESERADCIVVGMPRAPGRDAKAAVRAVLSQVRKPLVIVPEDAPLSLGLGRHAMVAWTPAAAGGRDTDQSGCVSTADIAQPLLLTADRVTVITAPDRSCDAAVAVDPELASLTRTLAEHGIRTQVRAMRSNRCSMTGAALAEAYREKADILIVRNCSHNRLTDMVVGAPMRRMLVNAALPVFVRN